MALYLTIFFIPVIYYLISYRMSSAYQVGFLFLYVFGLGIFVGIGDMLGGYDRYIYGELFDNTADDLAAGIPFYQTTVFLQYPTELGYDMLNVIVAMFSRNRYIFILVATLLIYTSLFISFARYISNPSFALVVFFGLMFFFTFTYLRQILGVSIVWHAIAYVQRRKFLPFVFLVIIASLFHNSLLLFLPFYFLPVRKFPKKNVLLVMAGCFVFGALGPSGALFSAFGDVSGDEQRAAMYAEDTSGFLLAYFIEAVFFLFFIMQNYEKLGNGRRDIVLLNMALAFCGVLLFFIRSENGGRLSWCFLIGIIAVLTTLATRDRGLNGVGILLIVVNLFLYMRIFNSWQIYLNLYPYKTFFTNGYREGDYSWDNYEYDHNYDYDKFYR